MDEQESKVTQYPIPANVTTKFEFIEGFGWRELFIVLTAIACGVCIFYLLGLPHKTISVKSDVVNVSQNVDGINNLLKKNVPYIPDFVRAFAIIIPGGLAFFLVRKPPFIDMSLLVMLQYLKNFKKRQKRYKYKYRSGTEG